MGSDESVKCVCLDELCGRMDGWAASSPYEYCTVFLYSPAGNPRERAQPFSPPQAIRLESGREENQAFCPERKRAKSNM